MSVEPAPFVVDGRRGARVDGHGVGHTGDQRFALPGRSRPGVQTQCPTDGFGHHGAGHRCCLGEDAEFAIQRGVGVRVPGVEAYLLTAAEYEYHSAQGDQWPQCLDLVLAQRTCGMEGADGGQCVDRREAVVVQQRGQGHRNFVDRPRSTDIAEVDDGVGERPGCRRRENVVVGDVEVTELKGQVGRHRMQLTQGRCGDVGDEIADILVRLVGQQRRDDAIGMAQIPLQHPARRRVVDIGECDAHLSCEFTHPRGRGGGEIVRAHQRCPRDEFDDPAVDAPLRRVPPCGHRSARADDHLRGTQRRLSLGNDACGEVLQLDLGLAEHRVAELEDADRGTTVDVANHEVLVLLAAQFGEGACQSEV